MINATKYICTYLFKERGIANSKNVVSNGIQ